MKIKCHHLPIIATTTTNYYPPPPPPIIIHHHHHRQIKSYQIAMIKDHKYFSKNVGDVITFGAMLTRAWKFLRPPLDIRQSMQYSRIFYFIKYHVIVFSRIHLHSRLFQTINDVMMMSSLWRHVNKNLIVPMNLKTLRDKKRNNTPRFHFKWLQWHLKVPKRQKEIKKE